MLQTVAADSQAAGRVAYRGDVGDRRHRLLEVPARAMRSEVAHGLAGVGGEAGLKPAGSAIVMLNPSWATSLASPSPMPSTANFELA
jgi:hypothetical protein